MKTVIFGKRLFETELIIFDKDGTLTDFKKTWIPILEKRIEIILKMVRIELPEKEIRNRIYATFGINGQSIDPYGPFPYTPPWEDEIIFATVLYKMGVPWQKGKAAARCSFKKAEKELDRGKYTELYQGVQGILKNLKANGILISLATADLTDIANDVLKHTGVDDLFDYVIGADMVDIDKPNPEMVNKILGALKVDKKKAVLVGDSIADMEMGKNAGLGLVVGVTEAGVAVKKVLEKDADVVISSVREIRVV